MTSSRVAVLGAGPHGLQIAHNLRRKGFDVEMFDDALPHHEPTIVGASRLPYVVGAAWPKVRQAIVAKVGVACSHERGIVIFPGAQIGFDAEIDDHTHVGHNATISHGCMLGKFVQVCPGAQLAGDVHVGDGALIGIGAVILHGGIRIGAGATVGAGAVVTTHVPDGATFMGNPAREYRS